MKTQRIQLDRINKIFKINRISFEPRRAIMSAKGFLLESNPVNLENLVNPVYFWTFVLPVILCLLCGQSCLGQGTVTALAFSPDGKTLAVGTYRQVVLYDATNWQPMRTCLQVEDYARALAFSPDGKTLAIGCGEPGRSGRIVLWDSSGTATKKFYTRQNDTIEALAFRLDGKGMLVAAKDKKACYFPALPSEQQFVMEEHNGRVQAVAFSPKESALFVTGGMDRMVKVWEEKYRRNVVNFDQSEGGITGLAFLNSGNQFVGSSLDGRLYWWQVDYNPRRDSYRGSNYRRIGAHEGGVFALALSGDGKRLVTTGADKIVSVWEAESGNKQRDFKDSTQPNYAVALSPDGKTVVAGGREGVVRVWDVEGNKLLQTLTPPLLPSPPKANVLPPPQKPPRAEKRK
jgi:WD40 repeat protein